MVPRLLHLPTRTSFFLFGARGTGKSTLLEQKLSRDKTYSIDLLDEDTFSELSQRPQLLSERLSRLPKKIEWVSIDEVQRVPELLNVVHQQIFHKRFHFALTGSSARKLKRGGANLLAGRALVYNLFPLTYTELQADFDLEVALSVGTLPEIFGIEKELRGHYLQSYAQTYLKEEILLEQLIRKINPFRAFLPIAAQMNGKILNYSAIARDVGVDFKTVQEYFAILDDTLISFELPAYHRSIRKQQRHAPKFFLFDTGVKRALAGETSTVLKEGTSAYGEAFEHLVVIEMTRLNSYFQKNFRFSYLRTKDDAEIDVIIERPGMPIALVEIKSSSRPVPDSEVEKLLRFKQDFDSPELFILGRERQPRRVKGVEILPWQIGIQELGLK